MTVIRTDFTTIENTPMLTLAPGAVNRLSQCQAADKYLVVLGRADHQHFCDDPGISHEGLREFTRNLGEIDKRPTAPPWAAMSELMEPSASLMQEEEMNQIICGLTTLQMDRVLKNTSTPPRLHVSAVSRELKARSLSAYFLELS
jgi:hypothetical protein